MKLASLKAGRDGSLVVVNRDLTKAFAVPDIAPTLQAALEDWTATEPRLRSASDRLNAGDAADTFYFDPENLESPLPRAYQWLDAGAYLHHMELARRARNAEMPPDYDTDPAMHQGASDDFRGPRSHLELASEDLGLDFEAEVAVVTDDVPLGVSADDAGQHIKLLMLVNDVTLRNLVPAELAKGVGFVQSKVANSFSPVAVTPDELSETWADGKVHLPLLCYLNGQQVGAPNAGVDMAFNFPTLLVHAAKTRRLRAGAILGSGTVSNRNRSTGSCCLAEIRMLETIEHGEPTTPFLRFGDRVRIEMFDPDGRTIFGAIDQQVVPMK